MASQRICAFFQRYKTLDLKYLQDETMFIRKYERDCANGIYVNPIWFKRFKVTNELKNERRAIHYSLFESSTFWGD